VKEPSTRDDEVWLSLTVSVPDPARLGAEIRRMLARRYPLSNHGEMLKPVRWTKKALPDDLASLPSRMSDWWPGESVASCLERAAGDFGLSSSTVRRLAAGPSRVSWRAAFRLQKRLGLDSDDWRRLRACLFATGVWRQLDQYTAFVNRERHKLLLHRKAKHTLFYSADEAFEVAKTMRAAARSGLPYTRADLATLRAADGIVGWRLAREHLKGTMRSAALTRALRHERKLFAIEAALLRSAIERASRKNVGRTETL
jgi:plasmid maintenance system antidote protein VapI